MLAFCPITQGGRATGLDGRVWWEMGHQVLPDFVLFQHAVWAGSMGKSARGRSAGGRDRPGEVVDP